MPKLKQPDAVCPACKAAHEVRHIGTKCHWLVGKNKRCGGLIIGAASVDDWAECLSCGGRGYDNKEPCRHCDGCGWIFIRDMPAALKDQLLKQAANSVRSDNAS